MSYIVAFIAFPGSGKEFPVQCFRTDVTQGEEVVVRRVDGRLKLATVVRCQYLNWECNARIECKRVEAIFSNDGSITLPKGSPISVGLATSKNFAIALRSLGWVQLRSRRRIYQAIYFTENKSSISYVFIRKNGIDIQVISKQEGESVNPSGWYERSFTEGKLVRHTLAHTTFNLYEGVLRFANSFVNNEENLERYFVPQGVTRKAKGVMATPELSASYEDDEMEEIGEYPDDMLYGYHCK